MSRALKEISATSRPVTAATLMDALRKTAQVISGNFGIEVVFQGTRPQTDGKTIYVPSLPEDAPDDLVNGIIGFVDHEVGHILHTDFECFTKRFGKPTKAGAGKPMSEHEILFNITNAIEDVRMERLLAADYKGVGLNLERTHAWCGEEIAKKWEAIPPFMKILFLAMKRAKSYDGWKEYPLPEDHFAPILDEVDDEVRAWTTLPDTNAAIDAAIRFRDKLKDLFEPPMSSAGGAGDDEGEGKGKSKSKSSKGEKGKGNAGGKAKSGERSDEAGSESDEGSGEGDDADAGDQDGSGSGDGSDDGKGEGSGEEGEADGAGADADSPGGSGDAGKPGDADSDPVDEAPPSGKTWEGGKSPAFDASKFKKGDIEDLMRPVEVKDRHTVTSELIEKRSDVLTGYRPFTTRFDRTCAPEGTPASLEAYNKIFASTDNASKVVAAVFRRSLLAKSRSRVVYGLRQGKVSVTQVAQVRCGNGAVFKRKIKGLDLDTYVELLIDHSGSMSGGKINLATQASIVLAEALDKVNVKFGISGFTCHFDDHGLSPELAKRLYEVESAYRDRSMNFDRYEPLVEFCYKTADEPLSKARPLLPLMPKQNMSNNCDGESVLRVAKRIMKRKEKRKILIVLSDGAPAFYYNSSSYGRDVPHAHMLHVSKMLQKTAGLDVIGIGIATDQVKKYYPKNVVINSISDLPKVVVSEMKDLLLG